MGARGAGGRAGGRAGLGPVARGQQVSHADGRVGFADLEKRESLSGDTQANM